MSNAIATEVERHKQRWKHLQPVDALSESRDYKTLVHTLELQKLEAMFRCSLSEEDNGACREGPCGLREDQARINAGIHGRNAITPPVKDNIWLKLAQRCFCGIFNLLLWSCVVAEIILAVVFTERGFKDLGDNEIEGDEMAEIDYVTPCILSAVIIMAATLQWYSELKAESQMEAMQQLQSVAPVPTVRIGNSGGRLELQLDPINLVPGDIVFLTSGDRVPADVRILSCSEGTEVDNSALTGESVAETRHARVEQPSCPPTEAGNLAFFGTSVLKGRATCLVHATGDATFLGKIALSINSVRTRSTLEEQIEHFVHIVAAVAVCVGTLSFVANFFSSVRRAPSAILQNSAAALFAQVPEGLLPTVTISLMIASDRLARRDVIVRKINAVETLG